MGKRWLNKSVCLAVLLLPFLFSSFLSAQTPFEYVNPFVGTGGHGHTFPGATLPFGMVQLSPDTRLSGWDGCSGYHDSDSIIYGFSHTHLSGTGVSDYGDILLTPFTDHSEAKTERPGFMASASLFEKKSETAEPGYYAVTLKDFAIRAEMTTGQRVGFHRYTLLSGDTLRLLTDLAHRDLVFEYHLKTTSPKRMEGYRKSRAWAEDQRVYFALEFSEKPFSQVAFPSAQNQEQQNEQGKIPLRMLSSFDLSEGKVLEVKVGISAVSIAGARKNLNAEHHQTFDQARKSAKETWEAELNRVEIRGGEETDKQNFYTALYHSYLAPNLFTDQNGYYRGMDGQTHHTWGKSTYTVFSLWDTYRATHPLFTILQRERSEDFIATILRHYEEGGRLPVWELAGNETDCMIGYHAVSVIADAYAKGIRDFDTELALEAMVHSATEERFGLEAYQKLGYIPADVESESVSKTLEYAYDDWCIATFARSLGADSLAVVFEKRAHNWLNLWPGMDSNHFAPREAGAFLPDFNPREVNFHFTEANAMQYAMAMPQHIDLLKEMGDQELPLSQRLDAIFETDFGEFGRKQADITGLIGNYAHGNEPSHHMAYLYRWTEKPWRGEEIIGQICDSFYAPTPDGLIGNEDCGQMSSWYVFSAMGFYPVVPGSDEYVLGTPRFKKMTLSLENGKKFRIKAAGLSEEKKWVQKVFLNGKLLSEPVIRHEQIMAGGTLKFVMGPKPGTASTLSINRNPKPTSFLPTPYIQSASTFRDSLEVDLQCLPRPGSGENPEFPRLFYTLDGSKPGSQSTPYSSPFTLRENAVLRFVAVWDDGAQSPENKVELRKVNQDWKVNYVTPYAHQYSAGGDWGLIDQRRGAADFRTGYWQGFQSDFEAEIDLKRPTALKQLGLSCLQDIQSWIWMPRSVQFWGSLDGKEWTEIAKLQTQTPEQEYGTFRETFSVPVSGSFRFLRVKAENYGKCPEWHLGAGGQAWIFADEWLISPK